MKIRSITYFLDTTYPLDKQALQRASAFLAAARPAFESAGYTVQTARLATIPFPLMLPDFAPAALVQLAQELEHAAAALGFDYVSLGPALPTDIHTFAAIPAALAATQNAFFSGLLTTPAREVHLPAVRAAAQVIHQAAPISADGFANLRFAALANVLPGSPFFPAAYHLQVSPSFAIATEAADLAVEAFSQSGTLSGARAALVAQMEQHGRALDGQARGPLHEGNGEAEQDPRGEGDEQVGGRTGGCDPEHVPARRPQVREVDRHRSCPAEPREEEKQGAHGIEVAQRIQREPAQRGGGGVAQPVGGQGVAVLVEAERKEKRGYRQRFEDEAQLALRRVRGLVELTGIEPVTSCLPDKRSPI